MKIWEPIILSILWLVNKNHTYGLPAEYHKNSHADESRHFSIESDFVPIIPSQVDPHHPIISLHSDPQLDPIDYFSSFYGNRHHHHQLSTSRPFSIRNINTSTRQQQQHYVSSTRAPPSTFDPSILGTGDFAVLRGGTFYENEDEEKRQNNYGSSFYDSARPFALPLESRPKRPQHFSDDPFKNFKDFADIAGVDSDFTNLFVVYANKNSTAKHEPRNILEQLQLLDQQKESDSHETEVSSPIKSTKLSKFKTKLLSTKTQTKEYNKNNKKVQNLKKQKRIIDETKSDDYVDPLVADS